MKFNLKKWGIVVAVLIVLVVLINVILGSIVSNVVNKQLEKINNKGQSKIIVEKVAVNIISSTLKFKGVSIQPDSLYFENFKAGKVNKASISTLDLEELKIKGFGIFNILFLKDLTVKKIVADGIDLNIYKSNNYKKPTVKVEKKKKVSLDSLFIKGINEIALGKIDIDDFRLKIFEVDQDEAIFSYQEKEIEITGIEFNSYDNLDYYFRVDRENLKVSFKNQELITNNGDYKISFNEIKYDQKESSLKISGFDFEPTKDRAELASTYQFNKEVYEVHTKEIDIHGIHLKTVFETGIVAIDSIEVDGLKLDIYKDQTKPFDLNKRPLFINQSLKKSKQPLNIGRVIVKDGLFKYREKHDIVKELMAIDITHINASINFITSIKDSLASSKKLTININGKLNDVAPVNVDMFMPYNTANNSFSFSGDVGTAQFKDFESALYPALGIKFDSGTLNSVQFKAHGTPAGTTGEMSMLYNNLQATILKDGQKKKKALSWISNSVLVKSNPSEKGKVKIALIEFERVPYKGFGNIIWKSFMSGMLNTLLPIGKQVKESKIQKKAEKEDRKDEKKESRKERRKERQKEKKN